MATGTRIGLCAGCAHGRRIQSARGSVFLRCAMHDVDPTFPKYPRLPVVACRGFEARPEGSPPDD